jgi:DNA modification methylase
MLNKVNILIGDCRNLLREMAEKSVHTCVTSPPYFGLRDYGMDDQIGLEQTPEAFVAEMVAVFREVKRVLRDDGTLWLNLGDSYASYRDGKATPDTTRGDSEGTLVPKGSAKNRMASTFAGSSVKHKDLIGIPWRVALALQADGWYLRQDIIWHKPNPMPESVTDRCTKAHEYIFLLSKSPQYYFDHEAIKEPVANSSISRLSQNNLPNQLGSDRVPFKTNGTMKAVGNTEIRNKRSVWTVTTKPFKGAHFATFPPDLIEPCILAGCPEGGTVLDPFGGAGTTGLVASNNNRNSILCELNPKYAQLALDRIGIFAALKEGK